MNPVEIAQAQLDAYNVQDLDRFCTFYAEDVVVAAYGGAELHRGIAALRDRYAKIFAQFPENHARLVNRVAVGHVVIDHEDVVRGPGGERFDTAVIYTIKHGRIAHVAFAR